MVNEFQEDNPNRLEQSKIHAGQPWPGVSDSTARAVR